MRWHFLPLVLLLAVAAVIFAGGSRLARREQPVRVERDRESIRAFASLMHAELNRLDNLYENYLGRIAREVPVDDSFAAKRASDWLSGVLQVSILSTNGSVQSESKARDKDGDWHYAIMNVSGVPLPRPALFPRSDRVSGGRSVVLPEEVSGSVVHESGWIEQPGNRFFFWYRRPWGPLHGGQVEQCVVILVDGAVVTDCLNRWMKGWVPANFHPVAAGTGGDQLIGPRNSVLAATGVTGGVAKRQPDFVLSVNTRFGVWQLLSWDGWEVRSFYHHPTLAASAALSLLVGLLGFGVFFQQHHAARMAAQRVSFINRVSHELRCPLTNILMNIDLATEAIDLHGGPGAAAERLKLVAEEGRRLGRLIDNVLTFSRKEQGRLRNRPGECIPSEIVRDVVGQFDAALRRSGVAVETGAITVEPCRLDVDALRQILTNLVSNVEKYAAGGGVLRVSAEYGAGRLKVVVSDAGPGIPPSKAERIFQPFYRLHDNVGEGVSGTGLGLSIARDLAVQMGGTLRLLPSGKGATFELDVPADASGNRLVGGAPA